MADQSPLEANNQSVTDAEVIMRGSDARPLGLYREYLVDWEQVKTLEDMKAVFNAAGMIVNNRAPRFQEIKKYLLDCEE